MYHFRKILPGNYVRKEVNGIRYIVGDEGDIKPQQMEFSDNHSSQMIEDFIKIDVEDSEEILNFTKSYGPIYSMGLEAFKESANSLGKDLPADIDEIYPVQEMFSFSEYDFRYFHELVINIWKLQNDIAQRKHDEKLFWDFFRLLFQPYGWNKFDGKHLGGKSKMPMAMFAFIYCEITRTQSLQIDTNGIRMFMAKMLENERYHNLVRIVHVGNKVISKENPEEYIKFTNDYDVLRTFNVITNLLETKIFDYLDCSFEKFKENTELKNIDDEIFQKIRSLGRILICDIVNEYISSPKLSINEKGDFVMEIGDNFLMNIIFDELVVLCQFYETRKCKFRKCNRYFISKKGKEKNYCCDSCADKEIKYQIREGRRSKKERKYQI